MIYMSRNFSQKQTDPDLKLGDYIYLYVLLA